MLEIFANRKTQRAFKADPVPQEHVNAILQAGCSAPTKQRIYPYRLVAFTQSDQSKLIKDTLFLESFVNVGAKKHLLTAKAPLLIAWVGIYLPDNGDLNLPANRTDMRTIAKRYDFKKLTEAKKRIIRDRAEVDMAISASFSMIQAEALGYRTAFTGCFLTDKASEILNLAENEWPAMFLSVGKPETVLRKQPVIKDGVVIGYSDPRPFAEPPKLNAATLAEII